MTCAWAQEPVAPSKCQPANIASKLCQQSAQLKGTAANMGPTHPPHFLPRRQMERRPDIRRALAAKGYTRLLDLSGAEREGRFFEGTGALVLDRINGVAYVALSERAEEGLAREWAQAMGYRDVVAFRCGGAGLDPK